MLLLIINNAHKSVFTDIYDVNGQTVLGYVKVMVGNGASICI